MRGVTRDFLYNINIPLPPLEVQKEIAALGRQSWLLACDLSKADEIPLLISQANEISPLYGLVNSAAIFEPLSFALTTLSDWEHHMTINLTAPFLLSQAFAKQLYLSAKSGKSSGRIVNILDWRALHPDPDHFPYTISKAALASMTKSLAVALAPQITVNGLALGAVLPPANTSASDEIIKNIPARRWSSVKEVEDALIFLLAGQNRQTLAPGSGARRRDHPCGWRKAPGLGEEMNKDLRTL